MGILIICTSMRRGSQSKKVSEWFKNRLNVLQVNAKVLDLYKLKLPMFDDGETVPEDIGATLASIESADGLSVGKC